MRLVNWQETRSDPLVFTVVTGPAHGVLTGSLPGVTYTPTSGYSGPDSFTFRASDGTTTSAIATVSITVTPSAPPPPPPPPSGPVKGKMFGQGRIDADGKPHHFGFSVEDGRGRGEALVLATWWRGPAPRSIVQPGVFLARSITAVQFTDDPALTPGRRPLPTADTVSFTATGIWNGRPGYVCEVTATDAGEPGAGRDSFTATVRSPSGEVIATVGGLLGLGNIQSSRLRAAHAHSARH